VPQGGIAQGRQFPVYIFSLRGAQMEDYVCMPSIGEYCQDYVPDENTRTYLYYGVPFEYAE
jgi:hypothetical protein